MGTPPGDRAARSSRRARRRAQGGTCAQGPGSPFDRLVERWAVSGSSLGFRVTRSIKLLDLYGDDVCAAAVADLDARGLADVGALAIACEQHRKDRRRPVPVELVLPAHLDDADVVPHDLGAYDE